MCIGVTGATGFIGSHLLNAFKETTRVEPFDRRSYLPSESDFKKFVRDKDCIYHLAGVNRGTDEDIVQGNLTLTLRLVNAIKHSGTKTRIVFASSTQVYDPSSSSPIKETRSAQPTSLYGVAKLSAEEVIRLSGLDYCILRFSNVYGPGCKPYYNSVIATLCDRAVKGQRLIVNGDGRQGRDFLYIVDAVSALFEAQKGKPGVYNVSSGKLSSLRQMVAEIRREVPGIKVEYKTKVDTGESTYYCDATKFMKQYGWKSKTSLRRGIQETIQWKQSPSAS